MNTQVCKMACCMAFAVTAGGALATHRFVSANGQWMMPGMTGTKYSSLSSAVTAARAGDTVWVKDGFVCETGSTSISSVGGKARVKLYNAAFTLRSESGYVDEAAGKGATIRGTIVTAGALDASSVRPVWSQNAGTVIQGFVLENGATGSNNQTGLGGAVYGPAVVSNCVIRNCWAYAGGAFGSTTRSAQYVTAYNTVISNCHAMATSMGGGAVYGAGSLYNCTIADNTASSYYGGAVSDEDTTKATPTYSGCVFRGNRASQYGGVYLKGPPAAVNMSRCQFLNNEATASGAGGVGGKVTMTGCTFVGNRSAGGPAALDASAGGLAFYSCLFGGNRAEDGGVVAGNATSPLDFYNCTVAGNESPNASCVSGVNFHNSIIWGNTYAGSELTGNCTAEYSCVKDVSGDGNIDKDPLLTSDYRLMKGSPCVDTAKVYDWMTSGSAQSFDAAGYPRIRGVSQEEAKPDMGCYERECPGSVVIGR